jgi:hypothetical protein
LEQKLEDQRLEERRLKEQRFEGRVASESQDGTRTRLTPSSEHTVENDSELAREAFNALTFFAKEFRKFNKSASNINGARESDTCAEVGVIRSRKRRCAEPDSTITPPLSLGTDDTAREIVFQVYFSHVHPWIPMIHEGRLRRRLQDKDEAKKLEFVVNAILLASSKYLEKTTVASQTLQVPNAAELSRIRDQIVTSAMKGLSVENLQALVVVVFTDVSCRVPFIVRLVNSDVQNADGLIDRKRQRVAGMVTARIAH